MIALILSILLFIFYNLFVIFKYKTLPVSLSETSYIASPTWFSSVLGTEALLILVPWTDKSAIPIIPYIGTIALIVCGSAPLFKESFHKTVHYVSAIIALTVAVFWLALNANPMWWYTLLFPIAAIIVNPARFVYWVELWIVMLLNIVLLVGR